MMRVMRLITIPLSHYCERARWALDRVGLSYHEDQHLQAFHIRAVKRAGGNRMVPVLVTPDGGVVEDSAEIVRYADLHSQNGTRLYPTDSGQRAEIEALERQFEGAYGYEVRRLGYDVWLSHRAVLLRYNSADAPRFESAAVRVFYPAMRQVVTRMYKINDETVARGRELVEGVLGEVAARLEDGRRYLVGDQLTAADITFAAMSALLVWPKNYGVPVPSLDEMPEGPRQETMAWRRHPALRFALRLYEERWPPGHVVNAV